MKRSVTTDEAACQTVLQCSPHILREGDIAVVYSDESTQTVITASPLETNDAIYSKLGRIELADIAEDSLKVFSVRRKPKLQFHLPGEDSSYTSLGNPPLYDVLNEVINEIPIVESHDIIDTPEIFLKPVLKRSQDAVNNVECQTTLNVYPHILVANESATVFTEIGVQTSVTCSPSCSISDIVPKLKAYLDHGKLADVSGDTTANRSILDIIKGIIEEVENSHKHMFDENYVPPIVPNELINENISNEVVLKKDASPLGKENELISYGTNILKTEKNVENEVLDVTKKIDTFKNEPCICTGFKIKLLFSNMGGDESKILNELLSDTGVELNVLPGLEKVNVKLLKDIKPLDKHNVEDKKPCSEHCSIVQTVGKQENIKKYNSLKQCCDIPTNNVPSSENLQSLSCLCQKVLNSTIQTKDSKIMCVNNLEDGKIITVVSKNTDGLNVVVNLNELTAGSHDSIPIEKDLTDISKCCEERIRTCYCSNNPTSVCLCKKQFFDNKPDSVPLNLDNEDKDDDFQTCSEGPSTDRSQRNAEDIEINVQNHTVQKQVTFPENNVINLKVTVDLKNFENIRCLQNDKNDSSNTSTCICPHKSPKLIDVQNTKEVNEIVSETYLTNLNSYLFTASSRTINILTTSNAPSFESIVSPVFAEEMKSGNKQIAMNENVQFTIKNLKGQKCEAPCASASVPDVVPIYIEPIESIDEFDSQKSDISESLVISDVSDLSEGVSEKSELLDDSESLEMTKETKAPESVAEGTNAEEISHENKTTVCMTEDNTQTVPTVNEETNTYSIKTNVYQAGFVSRQEQSSKAITSSEEYSESITSITRKKTFFPVRPKEMLSEGSEKSFYSEKTIQTDNNVESSNFRRSKDAYSTRQDPVIQVVKACEEELKPVKLALSVIQQKLKTLNIPEINSIFSSKQDTNIIQRHKFNIPAIKNQFGQIASTPRIIARTKFYINDQKQSSSLPSKVKISPSQKSGSYQCTEYNKCGQSNSYKVCKCTKISSSKSTLTCPYVFYNNSLTSKNVCSAPNVKETLKYTCNTCNKGIQSSTSKFEMCKSCSCESFNTYESETDSTEDECPVILRSDVSSYVTSEEFTYSSSSNFLSDICQCPRGIKRKHCNETSNTSSSMSVCPFMEVMKSVLLADKTPKKKGKKSLDLKNVKLQLHIGPAVLKS